MKHFSSTSLFLLFLFLAQAVSGSTGIEISQALMECPYLVTINVVRSQTSCTSPDGELQAQVTDANGNPLAGNFSYKWYPAEHLQDPQYLIGTTSGITNLLAATYAVEVTDQASGCTIVSQGTVPDNTPGITMRISILNDEINSCGGSAGGALEIEVITEDGSQNVETRWYSGSIVDPSKEIPEWKNMLYNYDLPAGTFTIQTRDNNTGCFSDPYSITITEVHDPPLVTGTLTPTTSCDEVMGNGSISLTISASCPENEPADGYSVEWFYGEGITGTPVEMEKRVGYGLEGLVAGSYTTQVTNPINLSKSIKTFIVEELQINLIATVMSNTACVSNLYNGSLQLQINTPSPGSEPQSGYIWEWFYGEAAGGTPVGEDKKVGYGLEGMDTRNYTVQVTNPETQCQSTATFFIPFEPRLIDLMASTEPNTVCDPTVAAGGSYTGAIHAQLMVDGVPVTDLSDFQLRWFMVSGGGEILLASNNMASLLQLQEGQYKVEAIHQPSGCTSAAFMVMVEFAAPNEPALTAVSPRLAAVIL